MSLCISFFISLLFQICEYYIIFQYMALIKETVDQNHKLHSLLRKLNFGYGLDENNELHSVDIL